MLGAFLGIDSGTQATKAVLVEASGGRVLAVGRAPHALIAEAPGQKEQQPQWWVEALVTAAREAIAAAPRAEIQGIAVSGQQHGLVVLDAGDEVLRPAKLWNDVSCAPECEALMTRLGGREEAIRLVGNAILPGYTAGKLAWLKAREPAIYARTRRILLPHDYLNFWLTGERWTECGDASGTTFFDVRRRRWSAEVLHAIDPSRNLLENLPAILESHAIGGRLRPQAAEAIGLPSGIRVATGGGDNMMAALGTGNMCPGFVTVSLGTSGTAFAYSETPVVDAHGELAAFCDSTGGWLPLVCTMNMTGATEMVRGWLGMSPEQLEREASKMSAGAGGLIFLPYLEGERTPSMPGAVGVFFGLRRGADSPGHLIRAVMEGTILGLRYGMDILRRLGICPGTVCVTGGGARNPVWRQICADVFGTPVIRAAVEEAAAYGAALQACWAVTCAQSVRYVPIADVAGPWLGMMRDATVQEPQAESRRCYDQLYSQFRRLTELFQPAFDSPVRN